jgi:hypothetical protein
MNEAMMLAVWILALVVACWLAYKLPQWAARSDIRDAEAQALDWQERRRKVALLRMDALMWEFNAQQKMREIDRLAREIQLMQDGRA